MIFGIICSYIILLVLFAIAIKTDDTTSRIFALVLGGGILLYLVIEKPAFWVGHGTLHVVCDIISGLILMSCFKDNKDDEKKKDDIKK